MIGDPRIISSVGLQILEVGPSLKKNWTKQSEVDWDSWSSIPFLYLTRCFFLGCKLALFLTRYCKIEVFLDSRQTLLILQLFNWLYILRVQFHYPCIPVDNISFCIFPPIEFWSSLIYLSLPSLPANSSCNPSIGEAPKWNESSQKSWVFSSFSWREGKPIRGKTDPSFRKHREGKEAPAEGACTREKWFKIFAF